MKYLFKSIAAVALAAGISSCSGFLDEKVTTTYGGDNMVSTEEALNAAALGCYMRVKDSYANMNVFETFDEGSAINHWGLGYSTTITNAQERWACCLNFTRYSQHPQSYQSFTNLYKGVYRCNSLIRALKTSPVDEDFKKNIEGEAYFVRAWLYFFLVRQYGDCSLITEAPLGVDQVYKPRANFWEVYCQIIKDLEIAEKQLPDFDTMNARYGNSAGRVCNYAATATKGLVYLTIGTLLAHPDDNFWLPEDRVPDFSEIGINSASDAFTKSLAASEDVINNGPFKLCPSFQQLFRWAEPEDWQLKERIYVIPCTTESQNINISTWTLPTYYNNKAKGNGGRLRPTRWLFQTWCEAFGGTKGLAGKKNQNIYVTSNDPRLDASMVHTSFIGQNNKVVKCYPDESQVVAKAGSYSFPFCKKYHSAAWNGNTGYADLYVMRYAEVYLNAAEAAANLSQSPQDPNWNNAIKYANVVRKRARSSSTMDGTVEVEQPADITSTQFATKDEFLTAIFWDRVFELNFEQHEWYDVHRMGAKWIVNNICIPKNEFLSRNEQTDQTYGASGFHYYYYSKDFFYNTDWEKVRKGLICAYPKDELIYNTELDLNTYDPNKGQNPEKVYWR